MKTRFWIFCFSTLVSTAAVSAQLKPFGLDGKVVTALAAEMRDYGGHWARPSSIIYAGTSEDGVFFVAPEKEFPDWVPLGLDKKTVTTLSVQHFGFGPKDGIMLFAGVVPNFQQGDSTLIYRRLVSTPLDTVWTTSDSGVNKQKLKRINALNSYYFTGHTPRQPLVMGGDRGTYQGESLGRFWSETSAPEGVKLNLIDVALHWFGSLAWAAGALVGRELVPATFRSDDKGKTWTPFLLPTYAFGEAHSIAINPRSADSVYAGMPNIVWMTGDSGKTWKEVLSAPNTKFTALAVDPLAPENVFAGGTSDSNTFVFYHSSDGGSTWTRIVPIPTVHIAGVSSILVVQTAALLPRTFIFIGTFGTGVWRYEPTTSVVVEDKNKMPVRFVLHQNYPNPFNTVTVISYQLKVKSFTTVTVMDLLGREVAILVNEEKSAGSYSVRWDAAIFPSGVYFYRLYASSGSAGNFFEMKKLLLMK